ncbi:probable sterigmatocystin biosynthesis P450 monooxygenase stcF [Aspergillus lentulus]|nr:probable sterigmatocystin biosynthesis P450 monooxygenase stcF [Aspergillus lentulus]GFF31678.1 probable sterigmatocystin biosynthesis P450 monooxygenase stcF [Aspergillus lentulus]GFF79145.1 probable sterigmatocystin biosynthesis P450 monooxygenase stcF [Aspergillus lentulus]GFG04223.1 probable sterigmatocystin biosynthesis P450 monooxygenase stcF [Aspergillus lentulus]
MATGHGGDVLYITSLPQSRVFSYEVSGSSDQGKTVIHAAYETQKYAESTPFTQWTIKILNPGEFDLKELTSVEVEWTGTGRFGVSTELSSRGVRGAPL